MISTVRLPTLPALLVELHGVAPPAYELRRAFHSARIPMRTLAPRVDATPTTMAITTRVPICQQVLVYRLRHHMPRKRFWLEARSPERRKRQPRRVWVLHGRSERRPHNHQMERHTLLTPTARHIRQPMTMDATIVDLSRLLPAAGAGDQPKARMRRAMTPVTTTPATKADHLRAPPRHRRHLQHRLPHLQPINSSTYFALSAAIAMQAK